MTTTEPRLEMLIWEPELETMPRHDLEKLQSHRLHETVVQAYRRVPFYRRVLDEAGIDPQSVRSREDLTRLPFTQKSDLRDNYPFGMFAEPLEKIVRLHGSSGTTGRPTIVGYTREDLETWTTVMARALTAGSVTARDMVHSALGHGIFTGGFGFYQGAERLGATVLPIGVGLTQRQLMLIEDCGATVLASTPSYATVLAEAAANEGIDLASRWKLRVGFFGAEPWSERMREEIESRLGITALDVYGLAEIIGPGVAAECAYQNGMHVFEDHFLPEIIDPTTGKTLEDGQRGELVLTTLTKEGMPMIRYRTCDITRIIAEPCPCGRTTVRLERIAGRTDDMLIVRGVNVYPSQVEWALLRVAGLQPHYLIVLDRRRDQLDEMEVRVEACSSVHEQGEAALTAIQRQAVDSLHQTLGLNIRVTIAAPGSLPRSEGKCRRVIDRREI